MNRLVLLVLNLLPPLFLTELLAFVATRVDKSGNHSGLDARSALIRHLTVVLAEARLTETELAVIPLIGLGYAVTLGIFTRLLLGDRGFGQETNGAIMFVGGVLGLEAWFAYAPKFRIGSLTDMTFAAVLGSTLLLVACVILKTHFFGKLDGVASGASAPPRPPARRADLEARRDAVVRPRRKA